MTLSIIYANSLTSIIHSKASLSSTKIMPVCYHHVSPPQTSSSTTQIPLQTFPDRYLSPLSLEQHVARKQIHLNSLILQLVASDSALRAQYRRFSSPAAGSFSAAQN